VFWGGNGNYYVGTFDGRKFTPESEVLRTEFGANCYAAQTWSDIPKYDSRRIQIAWMSGGKYPDMPFNQQMCFPCKLTLKTTPEGIRLFRQPVREIENLHQKEHHWNNETIKSEENLLSGDLFGIRAEFELGKATEFGFVVRGEKVQYKVADNQLSCLGRSATLKPIGDKIRLQILVDRTSIEVFGNDGRISLSSCFLPNLDNKNLGVYADGGDAKIASMDIFELRSAWD
jgi:sucrose-6-phosphate hydrolase SacC (GH32 family)